MVDKLPWFALSDPAVTRMLTIGDLYSHRSGLPDHAGDKLEDLGYDRRFILERLRQLRSHRSESHTPTPTSVSPPRPRRSPRRRAPPGRTSASRCSTARWAWRPPAPGSPTTKPAPTRRSVTSAPATVTGRCSGATPTRSHPPGVSSSVNDITHWLAMVLANGTYNGDPGRRAGRAAAGGDRRSSPARRRSRRCGPGSTATGSTSEPPRPPGWSSATPGVPAGAGTNFVIIPSADVAIVALSNATPAGIPRR